jgi:uncharacterized protein YutD
MEKIQSSIDWLEQEFVKLEATVGVHSVMYELIDNAKAMHKEEIIKANRDGVDMMVDKVPYITGEDYYNETYGGNNSEITMNNQSSTFPYVCASCNKEMVEGGFPKWFCLHTTCKNYLKPITK